MNVEVGTAFRMSEKEAGRMSWAEGRMGRGRKREGGGKKRETETEKTEGGKLDFVVVVVVVVEFSRL